MARIVFGGLQSDQADLLNGGLEQAENCVPYLDGYGPFLRPRNYTAALSDTLISAYSTKDLSNNVNTFVGSATKLYRESLTALNDVSRTATYTSVSTSPRWEFEAFGNTVIAANGSDPLQFYSMGSSSQFRDMSASASAPVAAHIAVVRDFLFTGNHTNLNSRVQWSRINNPLRYTPSQRFQSDYQDLPGTDQVVQRVMGGDFAAILTNTSVWRATYVGSPVIFRFDEVARNVACYAAGSASRYQNITFFLSTSGVQMFDGETCQPIGYGLVDNTIIDELNTSYLNRVSSTIDPVNKLYMLAYPSNSSSDGLCTRIAIYSWQAQRWSFVTVNTRYLFNHMTSGYTLEGLDAIGTLDALAFSLDSPIWQGGLTAISCITDTNRIARFSDSGALTASFVTGESELVTDARAFVRSLRPLIQGNSASSISAYVGGRDRLIDDVTWTPASTYNATGTCPVRSNARYHRMKLEVSGGFERVIGSEVEWTKEGVR